jgi:5-oxoprolinase (ATP-hydrolysing)
LRADSHGKGQHRGGDGVIRDIEFRIPVQVSILSERRVYRPYGLEGGEDAECGRNIWVRRVKKIENSDNDVKENDANVDSDTGPAADDNSSDDATKLQYINVGAKNTMSMQPGERIIVMTPGGGGWGKAGEESKSTQADRQDPRHAWRGGSLASRQSEAEASA